MKFNGGKKKGARQKSFPWRICCQRCQNCLRSFLIQDYPHRISTIVLSCWEPRNDVHVPLLNPTWWKCLIKFWEKKGVWSAKDMKWSKALSRWKGPFGTDWYDIFMKFWGCQNVSDNTQVPEWYFWQIRMTAIYYFQWTFINLLYIYIYSTHSFIHASIYEIIVIKPLSTTKCCK